MKFKKLIIAALVLGLVGALATWVFVFYLPSSEFYKNYKRNKEYENFISVKANDLVKEFQSNETEAYKKFTGKNEKTNEPIVLKITGEVVSEKMENGNPVLTLKSEDPMFNVSCTLLKFQDEIKSGSIVTVKGICTGFTSDVVVINAIISKD